MRFPPPATSHSFSTSPTPRLVPLDTVSRRLLSHLTMELPHICRSCLLRPSPRATSTLAFQPQAILFAHFPPTNIPYTRRARMSTSSPRLADENPSQSLSDRPQRYTNDAEPPQASGTPSNRSSMTSPPARTRRAGSESMANMLNMMGAGRTTTLFASRTGPAAQTSVEDLVPSSSSRDANPLRDILGDYETASPSGNRMQQNLLNELKLSQELGREITLRLKPALGRTVSLDSLPGSRDVTRAFKLLEMKCNSNNVRADEREQRTHVRRGLKKKVDRMKRWRVLFKDAFLMECARVRRMKKQGW